MRIAVLTVSDAGSRGEREDTSGPAIVSWAGEHGYTVVEHLLVPDEAPRISAEIARWADGDMADVVLTTGGTGLTPRDVTPEATKSVLEREAPGIAEAIRFVNYPDFHRAALARGVAGTRARTLVVNLPGSPAGVRDGLTVLGDLLEHAVALLRGVSAGH